jgi:hypothetical protein
LRARKGPIVRRAATVLARATLLVGAAASCDAVLGLGPKATLYADADATVDASGDAPKVPPGETPDAFVYACGMKPHPSATCQKCVDANCCDPQRRCAASPLCIEGTNCVLACENRVECVIACDEDYGKRSPEFYALVQGCSLGCQDVCYPIEDCNKLVQCCWAISDSSLHTACMDAVYKADQAHCAERQATVFGAYCRDAGESDTGDAAHD